MLQIVRRAGGRSEVQHIVHRAFDVQRLADIRLAKFELGIAFEMAQILRRARDQIIERENFPSFRKQSIAKMRPQKSSSSRHNRAHESSESFGLQFNVRALD